MHRQYSGGQTNDEEQQRLISSEGDPTGYFNTEQNAFEPLLPSAKTRLSSILGSSRPLRYSLLLLLIAGLISVFFLLYTLAMSHLGYYDFIFSGPRPKYLNTTVTNPLVIRLAVISRAANHERRQLLRDQMFNGVPFEYVRIEYKFFLGSAPETTNNSTLHSIIAKEDMLYNDLEILEHVEEIPQRISEKRFAALGWAARISPSDYDYFMTLDSDSFCRFKTLSQRLQHIFSGLDPRNRPILIGNMGSQRVYWENTVGDGQNNILAEDKWISGPRYDYPVGIGYMLSSNLAAALASADPSIPHHIHYPYDDVMIGSWISGLRVFHDKSKEFQQPIDEMWGASSATPKPYLPYLVDTRVIDDKIGWHDFKNRGAISRQRSIGWDTACVHRIKDDEVRELRKMEEVRIEWN